MGFLSVHNSYFGGFNLKIIAHKNIGIGFFQYCQKERPKPFYSGEIQPRKLLLHPSLSHLTFSPNICELRSTVYLIFLLRAQNPNFAVVSGKEKHLLLYDPVGSLVLI
jgi:hypothetical protein